MFEFCLFIVLSVMASDIFTKTKCTYCQDEVVGVRIKCAECDNFDLCLQCFSAGAEIGPHKSDHAYQFVDTDALDLFKSKGGWSAKEELLLLSGIEIYGFGNWEEISLFINKNRNSRTDKTPEECRDEYLTTFVEGSIGRLTWPWALKRRSRMMDMAKSHPEGGERLQKLSPVNINFEQGLELGYMPKTDHFEKEHEDDAETLISHLNISGTQDDELDIALKLAQVDMYCQKLRERMRRKRVARDYQLVTKFFNPVSLKSKYYSSDHHDLEESLKTLTPFLTATEFDSLVSSHSRQLSLRRRNSELIRYRNNGLTRFEEIPHFEQEASARDKPPNSASFANEFKMLEWGGSSGAFSGATDCDSSSANRAVPPSPSALSSIPSSPADKKKRKKHGKRMRFHRAKQHAPHRAPHLIAAARAAARAAGLIR